MSHKNAARTTATVPASTGSRSSSEPTGTSSCAAGSAYGVCDTRNLLYGRSIADWLTGGSEVE